jgi:large subunit ribosomal protein L24
MNRIKKNDTVMVISGKDKGKQGSVLALSFKNNKVLVKGVCMMTHHVKPRKQGEVGGIKKQEGLINLSNVMPICSACKKPCRVNVIAVDGGKRARACNICKEIF